MGGRERWGDRRSGNAVEVRVAARLDNLAVLRTVAAAIGAFARLDDAGVADLRLAVDKYSASRPDRRKISETTLSSLRKARIKCLTPRTESVFSFRVKCWSHR